MPYIRATRAFALVLALAAPLLACSEASPLDASDPSVEAGSPSEAAAPSEAANAAPETKPAAATRRSASGHPPLPEAVADDGTLPRTYAGLTLGDPPPDGAERLAEPPSFFPEATSYLLRPSETPRIRIAAYAHDGTIFHVEWRIRDPDLDREDVAAALAERFGPPEDNEWLPDHVTSWNDGLSVGSTHFDVRRNPGSDWLVVAMGDVGRSNNLLRIGGS